MRIEKGKKLGNLRWLTEKTKSQGYLPLISCQLRKFTKSSLIVWGFLLLLGCAAPKPRLQLPGGPRGSLAKPYPIAGSQMLAHELERVLNDSLLIPATVGIKVIRLRDNQVLFQKNSRKLFHPASNMKLFTSAAAFRTLGPNFRFRTRVAIDSSATLSDTLKSNIYLIGSGNPDFSLGDLAYLIEQIYSRGIRYIDGDIICDDFLFDDVRYGNGWMWNEGSSDDFAPIGALTIHDNSVEVYATPGEIGKPARIRLVPVTSYLQIINKSVSIDHQMFDKMEKDSLMKLVPFKVERRWAQHENMIDISGMLLNDSPEIRTNLNIEAPSLYFGTLFKEYCERQGIKISGTISRGVAPIPIRIIAEQISDPLSNIVTNMNKPSDNLSAELLLKVVGAYRKGKPGTAQKGIQIIKEMLADWKVDTTSIYFADGSGVSRYNLVTPEAIATLLANMYENFSVRSEFIASLPVAGVDGSLSSRMKNTAAFRVVHAKTGTLKGVSTLSGYTRSWDGEELAFSIMMANFIAPANRYRQIQDKICDILTRYRGVPAPN